MPIHEGDMLQIMICSVNQFSHKKLCEITSTIKTLNQLTD